jgi:hypothetical protein
MRGEGMGKKVIEWRKERGIVEGDECVGMG